MKDKNPQYIKVTFDPNLFKSGTQLNLPEKFSCTQNLLEALEDPIATIQQGVVLDKPDEDEISRAKTYVITPDLNELWDDIHAIHELLGKLLEQTTSKPYRMLELISVRNLIADQLKKVATNFPENFKYLGELAKELEGVVLANEIKEQLPKIIAKLPSTSPTKDTKTVISISVVKESLKKLGIVDQQQQDAVIAVVVQNRLGWPVTLGGTASYIFKTIADHDERLAQTDLLRTGDWQVDVTYNKKTKQALVAFTFDLVFIPYEEKSLKIGILRSEIIVPQNRAIVFKDTHAIFDCNELKKHSKISNFAKSLRAEHETTANNLLEHAEIEIAQVVSSNIEIQQPPITEIEQLQELEINSQQKQTQILYEVAENKDGELVIRMRNRSFLSRLVNFISQNPWKTAGFALGMLGLIAGIVLTATGVGSPLGLLLGAMGIKLSLAPAAATILDLLATTALGPVITGLSKLVHSGVQFIKTKFFPKQSRENTPSINHIDAVSNLIESSNQEQNQNEQALYQLENNQELIVDEQIDDDESLQASTIVIPKDSRVEEMIFTPYGLIAKKTEALKQSFTYSGTIIKRNDADTVHKKIISSEEYYTLTENVFEQWVETKKPISKRPPIWDVFPQQDESNHNGKESKIPNKNSKQSFEFFKLAKDNGPMTESKDKANKVVRTQTSGYKK